MKIRVFGEKRFKLLVSLSFFCFLLLTHSLALPVEVIKLSSSNYLPTTHPISKANEEFCKEIERRTNGRVKITFYGGGQLVGPAEMYDGVIDGVTDIGFSAMHYNRGRFPLSELFECPLGIGDNWVGAKVFTDFFRKYSLKEWEKTHPLLFASAAPAAFQMVRKQIRVMGDLQGQVIRAVGREAETIKALGGTPRVLPVGELYDNMAKGVIDGAKISMEGAKSFRLAEVCKYITFSPQVSGAAIFYLVMNRTKWNALPNDIQKIINEVSEKYAEEFAITFNKGDIAGKQHFLSIKGNEYYELPPSETLKWKQAVQPVVEKYIDETTRKGISGEQIRNTLNFVLERINFWTMKSKELGIPSILR